MHDGKLLRIIMAEYDLKGIDLVDGSGVSHQQISKFRNGKEISRLNFVKIIRGLPDAARQRYLSLVFGEDYSEPSANTNTISDLLKSLVDQGLDKEHLFDCILKAAFESQELLEQVYEGCAQLSEEQWIDEIPSIAAGLRAATGNQKYSYEYVLAIHNSVNNGRSNQLKNFI